jgi:trans-aconitate 2-methyltransferase
VVWDPAQYLKFAGERMRPAADLIARVPLAAPRSIVDLGCGTGNVTRMLAQRWPAATITGIDNSAAMLERAAEEAIPAGRIAWEQADLRAWAPPTCAPPPEIIFSNAALHWLDDHPTLVPRLFGFVARGGVLAVQVPDQAAAPSHVAMQQAASEPRWRKRLAAAARPAPVAPLAEVFRWLDKAAAAFDGWTCEYLHVLPAAPDGEHPVVAWTRGTALSPFLERLDHHEQIDFVADYRQRVTQAYPPLADGRVLFPFRRQFFVALRS